MDHATQLPDETAPVRILISGRIDARGRHDGTQVHIPGTCTDRGDVWIDPAQVSFQAPDASPAHSAELANALQDAAMYQRLATERQDELTALGDTVVEAIQAHDAGSADPLGILRRWVRGVDLVAAEASTPDLAEVTCTLTGSGPLRRLEELCAHHDMTADELVSTVVMNALRTAEIPAGADPLGAAATQRLENAASEPALTVARGEQHAHRLSDRTDTGQAPAAVRRPAPRPA